MIKNSYVYQGQRFNQRLGNLFIRLTGLRYARGVIMRQYYGGGMPVHRALQDPTWVDAGTVDGAFE